MKVLLIDVNCKSGSTGKIVYDLYTQLTANGDEAAICYGRGKKIKENNIYKFGLDWETYLHAFLTRLTGYTGCFSYFSTKRLIRYIKTFKPDVVHIHELHAYFINVVQLLSFLKKQNIKVVHTLHCSFSYTGKCGYHFDCQKWKTGCGKCPRIKEYVSTLCFDHTKHMLLKKKRAFGGFKDMTIVCPSKWLANSVKESFLNNYRIETIPNGINTDVFHYNDAEKLRKKLSISDDKKVVLAVAPHIMSPIKGGASVMKLAKMMIEENVTFIMVGADDCSIEHPSNVILLGKTNDQNELAEYYSMADVFTICSEKENFPTTCLEAQCCGTPICGFDVGGTKETSVFDFNAFVKFGDLDSLRKAILAVIMNNADKETNSRRAISVFSSKTMFDNYYRCYKGTK